MRHCISILSSEGDEFSHFASLYGSILWDSRGLLKYSYQRGDACAIKTLDAIFSWFFVFVFGSRPKSSRRVNSFPEFPVLIVVKSLFTRCDDPAIFPERSCTTNCCSQNWKIGQMGHACQPISKSQCDISFCRYDTSLEFVVTTNLAIGRKHHKMENMWDKMSIVVRKSVCRISYWWGYQKPHYRESLSEP